MKDKNLKKELNLTLSIETEVTTDSEAEAIIEEFSSALEELGKKYPIFPLAMIRLQGASLEKKAWQ